MLLDVSRLLWRRWSGRLPTGIDRVCLAYVAHYGPQARAVVQRKGWHHVLDHGSSQRLFGLLLEPGGDFRRRFAALAAGRGSAWVRSQPAVGELYLNIGHTGLDSPRLNSWIKKQRLRAIYFVHDLIPITHPQYCRVGEAEKHARRMETVLASAAGVIGNSQFTLDCLTQFAASTGRSGLSTQVVAHLGNDLPARPDAQRIMARRSPSFLMVSTIEGRKNHLLLLQVWERLAALLGEGTPGLVIVGQRGWESEQAIDFLERAPSLRPHVRELDRCSDEELSALIDGATALLFPSLVEGYGLPLVEALAQGTPVIASDIPAFRELGGDIPDYIDPLDGPGWARAVCAYAEHESPARKAQLKRLAGYVAPSWNAHFAKVDHWLAAIGERTSA